MIDIEMGAQGITTDDEDIRGARAFARLADRGRGFHTAHRYEVHLSRIYRRSLAEFQKIAKRTQEVVENIG